MPTITESLEQELEQLTKNDATIRVHDATKDTAARILITAGADYDALTATRMTDTIIVGLREPHEWRGVNHALHADLDNAVQVATRKGVGPQVTLALGDFTRNAALHTTCDDLTAALVLAGASKVRYSRATGIADTISRREKPKAKRAYVDTLIDAAVDKLGRRPAAARGTGTASRLAPTVDWSRGLIVERGTGPDGQPTESVIADFAARRVRQVEKYRTVSSTRTEDVLHDIEIAVGQAGTPERREWVVRSVSDAELATPRAWLNRVPKVGPSLVYSAAPGVEKLITNALRAHDSETVDLLAAYERTGWVQVDDELVYLHSEGAIGIDGETQASRAELPEIYHDALRLPDPASFTDAERAEAFRRVLDIRTEVHRGCWGTALGVSFYALAGLGNRGSVGVYIHGAAGSGKTVTVNGINSFLSPQWGNGSNGGSMRKLDGTAAAIRDITEGLDDIHVIVDDGRDKQATPAEQITALKAIDGLARVAYEGGSATAARKVFDAGTKRWSTITIPWSPAIILTSELVLDDLAASTLARFLPVEVRYENAFASGNATRFKELTSDAVPQRATTMFIQWLAKEITRVGGLPAWREQWAAERARIAADLRATGGLSARLAENVSIPVVGHTIYARFIAEAGVGVTAAEVADVTADVDIIRDEIAERVRTWAATGELAAAATPAWQQILDAVRDAVAAGETFLDNNNVDGASTGDILLHPHELYERSGVRFVGRILSKDGRRYLALIPSAVAGLRALQGRFGTPQRVGKALAEVALPGEVGRGAGLSHQVRIARGTTRAILVPVELYDEGAPKTDAEDQERLARAREQKAQGK